MTPTARTFWAPVLLALVTLCCGCAPTGGATTPTIGATTPTIGATTPTSRVIWTGDGETGDLSQFQNTPWNTDGGGLPPDVVSSPVRDGHYAIRARIVSSGGKNEGLCCGSRSELVPRLANIHPGDDLWFSFSTLLDSGFPVGARWQTIAQWHQDTAGSPPLELSVQDGQYSLSGGYGHPARPMPFVRPLGPATTGVWVDWLIHIKFSPNPDVGYVELWRDQRPLLDKFHPDSGTMYPTSNDEPEVYLKLGYYRNAAISTPGTVYHAGWKVGTTLAAVG
jgi:hypothetical protein